MSKGMLLRWRVAGDRSDRKTPAWIGHVDGESGRQGRIAVLSRDAKMYRLNSGTLFALIPRDNAGYALEEPR